MRRARLGCIAIAEQGLGTHRITELNHRNIGITCYCLELAVGGWEEIRHMEDAPGITGASVARQVQSAQAQALDFAIGHFQCAVVRHELVSRYFESHRSGLRIFQPTRRAVGISWIPRDCEYR